NAYSLYIRMATPMFEQGRMQNRFARRLNHRGYKSGEWLSVLFASSNPHFANFLATIVPKTRDYFFDLLGVCLGQRNPLCATFLLSGLPFHKWSIPSDVIQYGECCKKAGIINGNDLGVPYLLQRVIKQKKPEFITPLIQI